MAFTYFGSRSPEVDRAWVKALAFTANSPTGLCVVHEPAEGSRAGHLEPASS